MRAKDCLPLLVAVTPAFLSTGCGIECSPDERRGMYKAQYNQLPGGDCGEIPDDVVEVDDDGEVTAGCTKNATPEPDDACHRNVSLTCPLDGGNQVEMVGTLEQTTDDASELEATITLGVRDPSGRLLCRSTYEVHYDRL